MGKLKVSILALMCLSFLCKSSLANQTVEVQHKKLDFPEKELIFSHESHKNGNDVYAACKAVEKSDERICKVVREKTPNSKELQSCDISLKLDNRTAKSNKNNDKLVITPFGKDHAIFYIVEEGKNASVEFSIINFNDCKIAEIKMSVMNPDENPKHAVIVIPYNDSFDVYQRDPNKCGEKGFCKTTINTEGKIINGPVADINSNLYQSFFPYIVPLCRKSRDKGIFYMKHVNGSLSEYDFIVRKPDGTEKSLGKYKAYDPTKKSVANALIGVCFTNDLVNSTVKCTQHDADSNLKFEVTAFEANDNATIVYMYNLPKGGMLIVAGKCEEKRDCELDEATFIIIKMDSAGKKVGTYKMDKMKFDEGIKGVKLVPYFSINEDNKYCLMIAQYKSTDSGHRNVGYISSTTTCLTDADFVN